MTLASGIKELLVAAVGRHREAVDKSFTEPQIMVLEAMTREILKTLKAGNKIILCGNGGSAADCQHIAAEFVVRFKKERKSLAALALTTDTSILTAAANDYDFDGVFARQIEGLALPGDLLIALSTSGNSGNILKAVLQAKEIGLKTLGFTGGHGGRLKDAVDLCFVAQTPDTAHAQEVHITALHAVAALVEEVFFGA